MSSPSPRPRPRPAPRPRPEPGFDPHSWAGALVLVSAFLAATWLVQIGNVVDHYRLNRYALQPRTLAGLWGVLTAPFLHAGWGNLVSDTVPVLAIGWVVMVAGWRVWGVVTIFIMIIGGAATWLLGPSAAVIPGGRGLVGDGGVVFGWLGYLLARAFFSRRLRWILVAVLVLGFFGTLLSGLFPSLRTGQAWQPHVFGFLAGVAAGGLLHPRRGHTRWARRTVAP